MGTARLYLLLSREFNVYRGVAIVGLVMLTAVPAFAQNASRPQASSWASHVDTLRASGHKMFALQPFVVPGTEQLFVDGERLDSSQYRLDYGAGRLWVAPTVADSASVVVARYSARPFQFKHVYRRHEFTSASSPSADSSGGAPPDPNPGSAPEVSDLFGNPKLQRSGSITRGVLAGNRRDMSVESGLRMELSGELAEGVTIQAQLTDENTPIQPEGTTQRISEFDRVSIQVQARYGKAELGDFDLAYTGTEFARFNRKLQGAALRADLPAKEGSVFGGGTVTVAGATARGQYRIQKIQPIDGVQGPYRLEGENGEQFVIVTAGSEVVYMDGQRLERGETNDYTIDYQTGELTFTPRRLITDDRRIVVEFQYTTFEFTRTLLSASAQTSWWRRSDGTSRARLGMTVLREADSRQFNAELGFTPLDSLLLVQAGDGLAQRSGAEPVFGPYDPEAPFVQYVMQAVDLPDGTTDSIYVAVQSVPEPGTQVYRVRFTRKGPNQGSYVRLGSGVNGIVYEYRGPSAGDYDPVRILPKPHQKRLIDFSGSLEPLQGVEVFGEWAGSLNDENRLSAQDWEDDRGRAYAAGVSLKPVALPFVGRLSGQYRRRYTGAHFESFDRIRPVEFARQWNLVSRSTSSGWVYNELGSESVDEALLRLDLSSYSHLNGEWGQITLSSGFSGVRQMGAFTLEEPGLPELTYRAEYVTSTDSLLGEHGRWLRHIGQVQLPLLGKRLVPRIEIEHEKREQRVMGTDSLANTSLAFVATRPGLSWTTTKFETGGMVELRRERDWWQGALQDAGTEWLVQTHLKYNPNRVFGTEANIGLRSKPFEPYLTSSRPSGRQSRSVALRWNGNVQPFQRAVAAHWFYEALSERTPLLQEIYIRTDPEAGQYVWEDDGDGVMEIDEFLPERLPNEGIYVKTYLPSDTLTSVTGVQARLRLELDPARTWRDASGWRRLLTNVATRSTFEVVEKSTLPEISDVYLLNLNRFLDPATTMDGRLRLAQEVYLFRSNSRYGLDLLFNQVRGLSRMTAGQEGRFIRTWTFDGRYRPADMVALRLTGGLEHNRTSSERYASRQYDIRSVRLHPELAVHLSDAVRLSGGTSYSRKRDAVGGRFATVLRIPLEARYALVQKLQLVGRAEVANVSLRGDATGLAQYELTDGRGPGRSFLWNVDAQYTINSYLRASFAYDGRAPANAPILHTMRLQLTASF